MSDTHSPPVTAEGRLKEVKNFFNQGELFRAYDLAAETLQLFPGNAALAHRAVLSLANAGATTLALSKYYEFGLDKQPDTDARSRQGGPTSTCARSICRGPMNRGPKRGRNHWH